MHVCGTARRSGREGRRGRTSFTAGVMPISIDKTSYFRPGREARRTTRFTCAERAAFDEICGQIASFLLTRRGRGG